MAAMLPQPHEMLAMFDRLVAEGKDRETAMLLVRSWFMANHRELVIEQLANEANSDDAMDDPLLDYTEFGGHVVSVGRVAARWLRAQIVDA